MNATLDGIEVSLAPKELPAFSFGLRTLQDPSKARGTGSTAFKIPATKSAKAVLGGVGMNQEAPGTAILRIGEGSMEIFSIAVAPEVITRDHYELVAQGGNASWFSQAKALKLNDLDLGESDPLDVSTMMSTWTDESMLLYFPLINYGQLIDSYTSTTNIDASYLRPGARVHQVLKKAFAQMGYSLNIQGQFSNLWKKLVLPSTTDKIRAAQVQLQDAKTTLTAPQTFTPPGTPPGTEITQDAVIDDPSSNIDVNGNYLAPFDQRTNTKLRVNFTIEYAAQVSGYYTIPVLFDLIDGSGNVIAWRKVFVGNYFGAGPQTVSALIDFGEVSLVQGTVYKVGARRFGSTAPTTFVVNTAEVEWITVNIPWQAGIRIFNASCLPSITVMDLLMGIANNRCLLIQTSDARHTVTLSWEDDALKPVPSAGGIDFTDRIDHSSPPEKRTDPRPARMLFRWKEDSSDYDMGELSKKLGDRSFGDLDVQIGGVGNDATIQLPFAATAMQLSALGTLTIPVMRDHDGTTNKAKYTWAPRLLIADGLQLGEWRLDGVDLTEAPKCYFVFPDETRFGLSFSTEPIYGRTPQGTAQLQWAGRIRRENSPMLKADTRWRDDELMDLDFGEPRLLNDGEGFIWAYPFEIDRHRFSSGEYTETTWMPV